MAKVSPPTDAPRRSAKGFSAAGVGVEGSGVLGSVGVGLYSGWQLCGGSLRKNRNCAWAEGAKAVRATTTPQITILSLRHVVAKDIVSSLSKPDPRDNGGNRTRRVELLIDEKCGKCGEQLRNRSAHK